MLRVASFDISDAGGINKLLDEYRLASGAHILVSDGRVCIPYEDGRPETNQQKIIAIQEQKASMQKELDLHMHSKKVNEVQMADRQAEVDQLESVYLTQPNDKDSEKKFRDAQAKLDQFKTLQLQGDAEIRRLTVNIEVFDQEIAALSE